MDFYLQYNRLYIQGPFPTFLTQNTVAVVVMEERLISCIRHMLLGVTMVMVMMAMVAMVMFLLFTTRAMMVMFLWRCGTS